MEHDLVRSTGFIVKGIMFHSFISRQSRYNTHKYSVYENITTSKITPKPRRLKMYKPVKTHYLLIQGFVDFFADQCRKRNYWMQNERLDRLKLFILEW